jgi:predicted O-methyltransferase YrrM
MLTRRSTHFRSWRWTTLSHPRASLAYLVGRKRTAQNEMVAAAAYWLFQSTPSQLWTDALAELDRAELVPPTRDVAFGTGMDATLGRWLYTLIRVLRPETVIETGVAHGSSSWLILNAMRRNDRGTLHSIDLPGRDTHHGYNVAVSQTGSIVPEVLRARWNLIIGDSAAELPRLLGEVDQVDVFFHDSDHSYEAMRSEFDVVVPRLCAGSVLVADDVQKNTAFAEACRSHRLRSYVFRKGGTATPDA